MPKEPVKRLVVLTHPFFHELRVSDLGGAPKEPRIPLKLKRVLERAAKDPGTHVIVSWSNLAFPHDGLKKLLKSIPVGRRHEPEYDRAVESKQHWIYCDWAVNQNMFEDDPGLVEKLSKLEFAPKVEVDSWGDYHDHCHALNLKGVLDFLEIGGRTLVDKVRISGGMPTAKADSLLHKAALGEAIPRSKRAELERERSGLMRRVLELLGRPTMRIELDWPKLKGR